MKTYSISRLGRACGLSRSTLLYYDRLELRKPSGRTGSGYRYYTATEKRRNFLRFQNAGEPIFSASDPALRNVLEELILSDTTDRAEELRKKNGLWRITDDNMASEFRAGVRFYQPEKGWGALFTRPGS